MTNLSKHGVKMGSHLRMDLRTYVRTYGIDLGCVFGANLEGTWSQYRSNKASKKGQQTGMQLDDQNVARRRSNASRAQGYRALRTGQDEGRTFPRGRRGRGSG